MKLADMYRQRLAKLTTGPNAMDASDPHTQMTAISEAQMVVLRCTTAKHVMSLLLSSERVYRDLLLALDAAEEDPQDVWGTFLALRAWDDRIRHDWEFRCFVYPCILDPKIVLISHGQTPRTIGVLVSLTGNGEDRGS